MKHSITVKFLAILLTAVSLVAAFAGAVGIIAMEGAGLYVNSLDELQGHEYESIARSIANNYANLYAAEELGEIPYLLKQNLYPAPSERSDADHWFVQLKQNGVTLSEYGAESALSSNAMVEEYTIAPLYPIVSRIGPQDKPDEQEPTQADENESTSAAQQPRSSVYQDIEVPDGYLYYEQETNWNGGSFITYYLYYYQAPEYTVTVYLQEEVLENSSLHILTTIYPYRYGAIAVLVMGLIFFAAGLVYLLWSAGSSNSGEVRPGGLNRIPLDIYAIVAVIGGYLLIVLLFYLSDWVENEGPHPGNLSLLAVNLLAITLLGIGFLTAFAAQIKVKGAYWWHHSATGWCCTRIGRGIRFLWRGCGKLIRMLPIIWQWLLTAGVMVSATAVSFLLYLVNIDRTLPEAFFFLVFLLSVLACIGIVLYGGYAFGTLMAGAKRMSEGDLTCKIPTKYLIGSFRDFARQLNALSETAKVAAEHEMRSERMKSELITNVSHDIKTPLTSIINFVDLLQRPHTMEQEAEYLDVLSRQSARMKKLIEDLMDLSKANTGNMAVNITTLDAAETVNQALGEFSDKLASAGLVPVFRQPEQPVMIQADGRLVWRVLSNLLSNAVKYALPGTRLYVDLMQLEDKVLLSLKNISKEELTVHADELMERFVRGDTSRGSEGSGLGLNIAKSLMEVQHGQMQLLLDGDLFKVTLIFPAEL